MVYGESTKSWQSKLNEPRVNACRKSSLSDILSSSGPCNKSFLIEIKCQKMMKYCMKYSCCNWLDEFKFSTGIPTLVKFLNESIIIETGHI